MPSTPRQNHPSPPTLKQCAQDSASPEPHARGNPLTVERLTSGGGPINGQYRPAVTYVRHDRTISGRPPTSGLPNTCAEMRVPGPGRKPGSIPALTQTRIIKAIAKSRIWRRESHPKTVDAGSWAPRFAQGTHPYSLCDVPRVSVRQTLALCATAQEAGCSHKVRHINRLTVR